MPQLFHLVAEGYRVPLREVNLSALTDFVAYASTNLSSELIWRLHYEIAQAQERASHYTAARKSYTSAYLSMVKYSTSTKHLQWKVLIGGARLELARGQKDTAFRSLQAAYHLCKTQGSPQNEALQAQNKNLVCLPPPPLSHVSAPHTGPSQAGACQVLRIRARS